MIRIRYLRSRLFHRPEDAAHGAKATTITVCLWRTETEPKPILQARGSATVRANSCARRAPAR